MCGAWIYRWPATAAASSQKTSPKAAQPTEGVDTEGAVAEFGGGGSRPNGESPSLLNASILPSFLPFISLPSS